MLTRQHVLLVLIGAVAVMTSATAQAEPIFKYEIQRQLPLNGDIRVSRLDAAKSTTIRVTRGGAMVDRQNFPAAETSQTSHFLVETGDVVEVYQPDPGAEPPVVAPPRPSPCRR